MIFHSSSYVYLIAEGRDLPLVNLLSDDVSPFMLIPHLLVLRGVHCAAHCSEKSESKSDHLVDCDL